MNPACDVAPDELIAFAEEELPERRMKELEAHVPICPACQARLAEARETSTRLRETLPLPSDAARQDLLIRLYQEAERQTNRPHRNWAQVASLTAVGGTFLLAALLLWSGIGQLIDAIPQPFQQAGPDQTLEWIADEDDEAADTFAAVSAPETLGGRLYLADDQVRSGIRVLVYQAGADVLPVIEVRQFFVDHPEPPAYMEPLLTVGEVEVYADNPDYIQELRWTVDGVAHHAELTIPDTDLPEANSSDNVEEIVQAFLDN